MNLCENENNEFGCSYTLVGALIWRHRRAFTSYLVLHNCVLPCKGFCPCARPSFLITPLLPLPHHILSTTLFLCLGTRFHKVFTTACCCKCSIPLSSSLSLALSHSFSLSLASSRVLALLPSLSLSRVCSQMRSHCYDHCPISSPNDRCPSEC